MKSSALHDSFDLHVTTQILKALGTIVAYNHLHSEELGVAIFGLVGKVRSGLLRWMRTDYEIMAILNTYVGVSATMESTPGNGSKHLQIQCGSFRILVIHDPDEDRVVPFSEYGKEAAQENEPTLFDTDEQLEAKKATSPMNHYTVVLFHSKKDAKSIPDVLEIRFPDGKSGYQAVPINLYERFSELLVPEQVNRLHMELIARLHAPVETVEDQVRPLVRDGLKKRKNA